MLKGLQSLLMPSPFPAAAGCSTTAARSAAGFCPLALLTAETGYDLAGLAAEGWLCLCMSYRCAWSLQQAGIHFEEAVTANGEEPQSGDTASYKATWQGWKKDMVCLTVLFFPSLKCPC